MTKGNCKAPIKPAQRLTWSTVSWSRLEHASPTATICQIKGFANSLLSPLRPPTISAPSIRSNTNLQALYLPINLPLVSGLVERWKLFPCLSLLNCSLQPQCPIPLHLLRESLGAWFRLRWPFPNVSWCWAVCLLFALAGCDRKEWKQIAKEQQGRKLLSVQAVIFCRDGWGCACFGGAMWGRGSCREPQSFGGRRKEELLFGSLLYIPTPVQIGDTVGHTLLGTGLSLGLFWDWDGVSDSARKHPRWLSVCWAVEIRTGGGILAVMSELWL